MWDEEEGAGKGNAWAWGGGGGKGGNYVQRGKGWSPDWDTLVQRVQDMNIVVRNVAPEHRQLVSWSQPVKFFVSSTKSYLGMEAAEWVRIWKDSCTAMKGKPGGTPLGQAPHYFGARFVDYMLRCLKHGDMDHLPTHINRNALELWIHYHQNLANQEQMKDSLDLCQISAKAARFVKGGGKGGDQRTLIPLRPTMLSLEPWRPAILYLNDVNVAREGGKDAEGQGLLPAERALWQN